MATFYSIEYANAIAVPPINNPGFIVNAKGGDTWFDYIAAGTEVTGDVIILGVIPRNVRLKIGQIQNTALGTGATLTISIKNAAITLSSAISMSSIAQNTFANTLALGFGTIVPSSITVAGGLVDAPTVAIPPVPVGPDYDLLIGTIAASTVLTAAGKFSGFLSYSSSI